MTEWFDRLLSPTVTLWPVPAGNQNVVELLPRASDSEQQLHQRSAGGDPVPTSSKHSCLALLSALR
jgi:hypothetical protein